MKRKLNPKTRLWMISIHIIFVGGWIGASFVMLMLSFVALLSQNKMVGIAIPDIMRFIDLLIIIPMALGIIITGALLSALTPWGFVKHWWVIAKEATTLFLVVLGAVWLSPLVISAVKMTSKGQLTVLQNPIYRAIHINILWTSIVVLPLLLGMVFISKLKPWGKVEKTNSSHKNH